MALLAPGRGQSLATPDKPLNVLTRELEGLFSQNHKMKAELRHLKADMLTEETDPELSNAALTEMLRRQTQQLAIMRATLRDMDKDVGGPSEAGSPCPLCSASFLAPWHGRWPPQRPTGNPHWSCWLCPSCSRCCDAQGVF